MADPKSVIDVRNIFQQQITQLADWADTMDVQKTVPPTWYVPATRGWSGNLFDLEGMSAPFSRQQHADDFVTITKDAAEPGTSGDLTLTAMQGDWLAGMERAYRARHKTSVRARIHSGARFFGHAHENGVLKQGILGYIADRMKQSKEEQPGG